MTETKMRFSQDLLLGAAVLLVAVLLAAVILLAGGSSFASGIWAAFGLGGVDLLVGVAIVAFGVLAWALSEWATTLRAEKRDGALSRIVGAASRAAGRINEALAVLPVGAPRQLIQTTLIAVAVNEMRREFRESIQRVGGTDEKLAGIVKGELGKLPVPAAAAALLTALSAAPVPSANDAAAPPVSGAAPT